MPVLTLRPIFVLCLGRPGSWGKLAVMLPAATFVSSPISASPMYERCGTFGHARLAAQNSEGMDGGVGLELDLRVDPRRLRVDDRHAREHVFFVHARA